MQTGYEGLCVNVTLWNGQRQRGAAVDVELQILSCECYCRDGFLESGKFDEELSFTQTCMSHGEGILGWRGPAQLLWGECVSQAD